MSHATGTLPDLGVAVDLAWDGGSTTLSVERAAHDEIVLFDVAGATPDVAHDVAVELRWRGDRGIWRLPARTTAPGEPDVLAVRPTAPAVCHQRRQAFRVTTLLPVRVTLSGRPLDAKLLNISETGMRLSIGAGSRLELGDSIDVAFAPEDREIRCSAIVRNRHYDGDGMKVGIEFVGIDETTAPAIRRRLLKEQVAQRSRARWDGDEAKARALRPAPQPPRGGRLKRLFV